MHCLKNLALSDSLKLELSLQLEEFRELEQELLEYSKNFYFQFEKKYLLGPNESEILRKYLATKS
jgi:hypothetical protein